jgi:hypothetical protein
MKARQWRFEPFHSGWMVVRGRDNRGWSIGNGDLYDDHQYRMKLKARLFIMS